MPPEAEPQLPGIDAQVMDRFARADSLLACLEEVDPGWIESMIAPVIINLKYIHHNKSKDYRSMALGGLRLKIALYLDPVDPDDYDYKKLLE